MLNSIFDRAFEQYVFDRVDNILVIAGVADAKYKKALKESDFILSQLMEIAREQKEQHPELLQLVMAYETAIASESGLAAEIAYREGIRDGYSVRQELTAFMQT